MRACSLALVLALSGLAISQPAFAREDIISGYAMPKTFEEAAAMEGRSARPHRMLRITRAPAARNTSLDAAIARHAAANGLPVELVHRVVKRESNYNPRASSKGNIGLMQIRHATARGVGYSGSASGLLDAETNLTYAVKYLAGAYQVAGGNHSRAVALYARGYHGRGVAVARRAPQVVAQNWETQVPAWGAPEWSAPGADMQAAPVSMREDAVRVYEPRKRKRARR